MLMSQSVFHLYHMHAGPSAPLFKVLKKLNSTFRLERSNLVLKQVSKDDLLSGGCSNRSQPYPIESNAYGPRLFHTRLSFTMAPVERSAVVNASASTIWETCLAPMKWETWDPDVKELLEVSPQPASCENGTTFLFVMQDGTKVPTKLQDVVKNQSLTFAGSMFGGAMGFRGVLVLTPQGGGGGDDGTTSTTTKVDYSFELSGCIGAIFSTLNSKSVVGGTEKGLANIVSMSEEASRSK